MRLCRTRCDLIEKEKYNTNFATTKQTKYIVQTRNYLLTITYLHFTNTGHPFDRQITKISQKSELRRITGTIEKASVLEIKA